MHLLWTRIFDHFLFKILSHSLQIWPIWTSVSSATPHSHIHNHQSSDCAHLFTVTLMVHKYILKQRVKCKVNDQCAIPDFTKPFAIVIIILAFAFFGFCFWIVVGQSPDLSPALVYVLEIKFLNKSAFTYDLIYFLTHTTINNVL